VGKIDRGHVLLGDVTSGFQVRKMFIGLLFVTLLWNPTAVARERETARPIPLFIDPQFSFSQVGTICLAPTLDLRADKTKPIALSRKGPSTGFFPNEYLHGVDQVVAENLKQIGYESTACNPVSATLTDLAAPSDTWLRKLDFGQSSWLFVLGVEDVCITCTFEGRADVRGYAVVSGFLFEKRPDGVRMVWHDRIAGILTESTLVGRKKTLETWEGTVATDNAVSRLLGEFEWRSPKRPLWLFTVDEENFSANCDAVWEKLKDALTNHPKQYKVVLLDASDRIVLFFDHHKTFMEDHVVFRPQGDACRVQATQSFQSNANQTQHWSELMGEVRASLPKQ
jgi:hypothetical protein